jgi:hypothetical protein
LFPIFSFPARGVYEWEGDPAAFGLRPVRTVHDKNALRFGSDVVVAISDSPKRRWTMFMVVADRAL